MTGNNWVNYKNGNYNVSLNLNDGTKIRYNDLDNFDPDFPESFDLKITNRCHNNCEFCHENSLPNGEHADILSPCFIDNLHPYTEIAIGGGNPLEHPDLMQFLEKLKKLKMVPSMTVRQNDFMKDFLFIKDMIDQKYLYGIGISLVDPGNRDFINAVKEIPNSVIHVINGLTTSSTLKKLAFNNLKILILGYKEVRKGNDLYKEKKDIIDANKKDLYNVLPDIINEKWFDVVSFDNLAIKQLNLQRLMSKEKWDEMYMGDDGIDGNMTSASMFIDLVKKEFAKNSCDMNRYGIMNNIEDMFNFIKHT